MKLKISHTTKYGYEEPVADSVNEIRLSPRTNYRQACYHHTISVEPNASLFTYEDFFGNRIHAFTVNAQHRALVITAVSTVVTHNNDGVRNQVLSPKDDWRTLADEALQNKFAEFLLPTPYTSVGEDVRAYADEISLPGAGVYDLVMETGGKVYRNFQYQPNATVVTTRTDEFLRLKKGVCQDFAHLMIAVCRAKGIPARYVSGYHFIGDLQTRTVDFEQASHAWVEAYIPGTGWLGFDPTNNNRVDERYVKLGHGRDYFDIVPVKGIYRGTPLQNMSVEVDVQQL
ncbi:transglutaminase family protein [Paenibacillus sp. P96]|uniref:Transglutaminase family protein n=1 Tax=Paenibacillus zeirhizosphaerae TaxID=2987519 RepID=A0ABT9FUF5_9BACL|nr:transglutaminase family protein [Paenibacillus sp. P96]MDP4098377.1 transglutaminase family protein [Paenibacillus sp. P96]